MFAERPCSSRHLNQVPVSSLNPLNSLTPFLHRRVTADQFPGSSTATRAEDALAARQLQAETGRLLSAQRGCQRAGTKYNKGGTGFIPRRNGIKTILAGGRRGLPNGVCNVPVPEAHQEAIEEDNPGTRFSRTRLPKSASFAKVTSLFISVKTEVMPARLCQRTSFLEGSLYNCSPYWEAANALNATSLGAQQDTVQIRKVADLLVTVYHNRVLSVKSNLKIQIIR